MNSIDTFIVHIYRIFEIYWRKTPLSQELIAAQAVAIYSLLHTLDVPGDEGAIWQAMIIGNNLSESEMKAEYDTATIIINSQVSIIELSTSSISGNQTRSGSLNSSDGYNPTRSGRYYDDYRLIGVSPGQQVTVDMTSTFDTYLQLVNERTGSVIESNDDGNLGTNSRLNFTAQSGIDYLIRATSYRSRQTGNYNLTTNSTTTAPDDNANLWIDKEGSSSPSVQVDGTEPPAPQILQLYKTLILAIFIWVTGLRELKKIAGEPPSNMLSPELKVFIHKVSEELITSLNCWLESESFCPIYEALQASLTADDEIRFVIKTANMCQISKLPWHCSDLVKGFPHAEVAFSPLNDQAVPSLSQTPATGRVKILAILGNSECIKIQRDRAMLEKLPDADVRVLVKPDRSEISKQLSDRPWDVLFFAGHSRTECENGLLYINDTDCLGISQIKPALKNAIAQGLKLAIFNSCDGSGFACQLAELQMPKTIFMREPVPDIVAQVFSMNFLQAFAFDGKDLYLSVNEARKSSGRLESRFPCARRSACNLGTFTGRHQYIVGSADTNDYRLYLDAPEKLEFALRGLTSDTDLEFLNSSNRVLASSTNSNSQDEYARIDNLNSGTYYVQVYPFRGDTNYELTLNLDQAGNSRSDARDLGTLTDRSALGDYEFSDFVGSNLGDSADYYEFQLDRPRQLSFALRGLSGNANVYLEDRNGTVLQSNTNSGTRDELRDYNLAANTTYYMRVASVGSDFTNYNLVLNPGNEVGSSSSGQVDLSEERFNVVQEPLNAGDSFDAEFRVRNRGSSNASSFRTGFYISTDSTITSSLAAGNTSSTITRRLTLPSASDSFWSGSKRYYIGMIADDQGAVSETSESNNTRYDGVDIEIQSSSAPSDQAGNSTSSARNLGTFTGRHQYSDFVGSADTNDYYRLYLDAPAEKLEFALRGLTSDADVQLLNSSNRVLARSNNAGSQEEYARIDNLNSGTYYLRVYRHSGDTDYDLTLNLDQAGNSRSDARDLGTLTDRSALGDYEFSDFVGSNLGDSADYYKFQLDRPRQLNFALRGLTENTNVYLEDRNVNVLKSATSSGTRDELKAYNSAYFIFSANMISNIYVCRRRTPLPLLLRGKSHETAYNIINRGALSKFIVKTELVADGGLGKICYRTRFCVCFINTWCSRCSRTLLSGQNAKLHYISNVCPRFFNFSVKAIQSGGLLPVTLKELWKLLQNLFTKWAQRTVDISPEFLGKLDTKSALQIKIEEANIRVWNIRQKIQIHLGKVLLLYVDTLRPATNLSRDGPLCFPP